MTPEPGRAGRGRWRGGRAGSWSSSALTLALLASGATAGEQWGWLGVRIRDLTEQEMEEITKKVGRPRGLWRADRPGHEGDAGGVLGPARGRPGRRHRRAAHRGDASPPAPRGRHAGGPRARPRRAPRAGPPGGPGPGRPHARRGRRRSDRVRVRILRPGHARGAHGAGPRSPEGPWWRASPSGAPRRREDFAPGDRILTVNDVAVATVEEFRARVQDLYLRDTDQAPRRARGRAPRAHPAARAAGEPVMKRLHILVVEDDDTLRELLARGAPRVGVPDGGRAVRRAGRRAARDPALRGRRRGHPLAGDGRRGDPPAPQAARSIDRGPHDDGRSHRGDGGGDAEAGRVRLPHEAARPRGAPPSAGSHPGAAPASPGGQRAAEPPGRAAAHERAGRASRRRWKR